MAGREPSQITLTVFAARNLQSKRKGETCHASVVFGLSKQQYVTETIESSCPEWNQEAVIKVSAKSQSQNIKFKVRDKDHVIGVVLLSVNNLSGEKKASKQWLPLTQYKKAHEVSGELLVECFVSEYWLGQAVSNSERTSPIYSRSTSQEDMVDTQKKSRFSFHHRIPSWSQTHSNTSAVVASSGEVSTVASWSSTLEVSTDTNACKMTEPEFEKSKSVRNKGIADDIDSGSSVSFQSHSGISSNDSMLMKLPVRSSPSGELSLRPQVTGVSPREGPVGGGQRVVLRGSNLGESKEDVVKVTIADVDCTSTLEFESHSKLVVITPSRHAPGMGPVQVETHSGGLGISSVTFSFVEQTIASPPDITGVSPSSGSLGGGERVVLRGSNLGECKEDVVSVMLAGVECRDTLEYFSPAKLAVTTLPHSSSCMGHVIIETLRGGVNKSSMTFSYVVDEASASKLSKVMEALKNRQEDSYQIELKAYKQHIKDLKEDNCRLREKNQALVDYIDNLLISILEVRPELLEVKIHTAGLIQ